MKTVAVVLALTLGAASVAVAQNSGSRGTSSVNRPNSSNFGWQDRQKGADESAQKYRDELATLSQEEWQKAALATATFQSNVDSLTIDNAFRIGGASADRKATSRPIASEDADAAAWVVEFGRKKPKVVTITLTDRAHTEVICEANQLLEAGKGYVGIFQTEFEIFCLARPGA